MASTVPAGGEGLQAEVTEALSHGNVLASGLACARICPKLFSPMSRVETIEREMESLSREEMRQVRDWLDEMLEDELEITDEFAKSIERGKQDLEAGRVRVSA